MLEDIGSREPCVLMVRFCAKKCRYVAINAFESLFFYIERIRVRERCGALLCGRDGRVAESQHAAQRRSMKNVIFNYRSKSASYVLSAPLLSHSVS